jgi:hypothetical protein
MTQSEEMAGDATGVANRPKTVSFAICTPFTAASGMHGAMILSCAATVCVHLGGETGRRDARDGVGGDERDRPDAERRERDARGERVALETRQRLRFGASSLRASRL